MNEGTSYSIVNVNVGDLAKPADTLIKKISAAVGGIFQPFQIKRIAKAEAEASLIRAEGEIQVTELHRRAIYRFVEEETKKQANIEQITSQALPLLEQNSHPEAIEDDWITNFFDKCRIVSDQEMQSLWSRVLSGEANAPGSYSKRTVNFVSALDKHEALLFSKLCGYVCQLLGDFIPIIYDFNNEIYNKCDIAFDSLSDLESIGLIQFGAVTSFSKLKLPKNFNIFYYSQQIECEMPKDSDNSFDIGHVLLTKIGQELFPICGSQPVDGFMEYILNRWRSHNYLKTKTPIKTL
jgi:hypothetical protein